MLIFYLNAFNQGWKFINRSFEEDVKTIKNSYMIQSGSHFWVAVWRDKIVGMIGLFEKESYKLKIAELKRMCFFWIQGEGCCNETAQEGSALRKNSPLW